MKEKFNDQFPIPPSKKNEQKKIVEKEIYAILKLMGQIAGSPQHQQGRKDPLSLAKLNGQIGEFIHENEDHPDKCEQLWSSVKDRNKSLNLFQYERRQIGILAEVAVRKILEKLFYNVRHANHVEDAKQKIDLCFKTNDQEYSCQVSTQHLDNKSKQGPWVEVKVMPDNNFFIQIYYKKNNDYFDPTTGKPTNKLEQELRRGLQRTKLFNDL